MELSRQRVRIFWIGVLLVLAFLALGYRLVDLQVIQHEEFRGRADRSHLLQITVQAHRGVIRDVRGEVLAESLPAKTIGADPGLIGTHYHAVVRVLKPLLRTNEAFLIEALRPRLRTNELGEIKCDAKGKALTNRFVRLVSKVQEEDWRAIAKVLAEETFGLDSTRKTEIEDLRRSIHAAPDNEEIRVYPNGTLAGPVLGFTDAEGRGLEGMEAFLHEQLTGVDGYIRTGRSGVGRELRRLRELQIPPEHGRDVHLTIDARLQSIAEEELASCVRQFQASGGCVVVVQPRTGRILAMASWPGYDPTRPPLGKGDARRRRNWALSHTFEPGSTFKLVAATGALNDRLVGLQDTVDCGEHGRWEKRFGREQVVVKDEHPMKERFSPLEQVIAKSSNVGTFQLSLRLGRQRYMEYIRRFGFDQKSGIRMPLEEAGQLRPVSQWSMNDFSRITMGYTIAVTPLQLAMAMSALGNDGRLMRPQIIDRIVAADGTVVVQSVPEVVSEVCRPEVAAKVREALKRVVEDGTGSLVKMERYSVAGKTGTAKIAPYREARYHSSFVGFFPTEAPELCIAVIIEDPNPRLGYYGGRVAGPAFRMIAVRAADDLGISPDLPDEKEGPESDPSRHLSAVRSFR